MDLGNQGIQDGFVGFCFLQKLVGVKQDLGTVGQLGGLAGVILQTGGQGTAEQGHNKHHNKGDRIILSVHMKGEARSGKKIVKNNNAAGRSQQTAAPSGRGDRGQQDSEDIKRDDVCLRQSGLVEEETGQCYGDQNENGTQQICGLNMPACGPEMHVEVVVAMNGGGIRNDVDIQIWRDLSQLFCQGRLAP